MIDYVKCFAIFFVVTIHSNTVKGVELGTVNGDEVNFIINTIARFAVPFFFVVSGYLFVQKLNKIQLSHPEAVFKRQTQYVRKYIVKLVKLYVAWFAFYFLFELVLRFIETEKNGTALKNMFTDYIGNFDWWNAIYLGSRWPEYHLWFLPALIWAIVLLYVFMQVRLMRVVLVVSLGFNLFGLFGQSYSFIYDVSLNTRDTLFFALFYVMLGGIAAKYEPAVTAFAKKIPTRIAIICLASLFIMQVLEGFITLQVFDGKAENYFLSTIPLVLFLFLLVLQHSQVGKGTLFAKIGANAVGIYVSHVFIMESIRIMMQRLDLVSVEHTVLWKIVLTPMVFIIAYLFYNRLQFGKKFIRSAIVGKKSSWIRVKGGKPEYQ